MAAVWQQQRRYGTVVFMPRVLRSASQEILPLAVAMPLLEAGVDKYLDGDASGNRKDRTDHEHAYGDVHWLFDGLGRAHARRRLAYANFFGEGLLTICKGRSWKDDSYPEVPPAEYYVDAAGETLSWHAGAVSHGEVQLTMAGLLFPANPECTTEFVIALQSAKRLD